MHREGIIKYRCDWQKEPVRLINDQLLANLNYWRSKLIDLNVIGSDSNNIGFGNISFRYEESDTNYLNPAGIFVITGSQTGHLKELIRDHLSLVVNYSIPENYVKCYGLIRASSEALTHAIFYQTGSAERDCGVSKSGKRADKRYNAVIHFHSSRVWERARDVYPATDEAAPYGTPELARSISDVLKADFPEYKQVIILGGHRNGVVVTGNSLDEAGRKSVDLIEEFAGR